jgi:hypothetical protein
VHHQNVRRQMRVKRALCFEKKILSDPAPTPCRVLLRLAR